MLKLIDENNKINIETKDYYAAVINEKDGTRFLSNVPNGNELVSVTGGFLCGAVNASLEAGLTPVASKALFEGILKQVFENLDLIKKYSDKTGEPFHDSKE